MTKRMIKLLRRIVLLKWQVEDLERRVIQCEYKCGLWPKSNKQYKRGK